MLSIINTIIDYYLLGFLVSASIRKLIAWAADISTILVTALQPNFSMIKQTKCYKTAKPVSQAAFLVEFLDPSRSNRLIAWAADKYTQPCNQTFRE